MRSAGAASRYSGRVWRSDDGLPQNRIQAISQTPDGYLWVGTSGGLVRFDGVRFTNFDRSNTPGLPDDSILSLCPARDGGLWVGTEGGGLVHMKGGVFSAYGLDQGLSNGFVRGIVEISANKLWVGTDRGFFLFDNGSFIRLDGRDGVPIFAVRSMVEEPGGRIITSTSAGLFAVAGGRLVRTGPRVPDATGLMADPDGSLWLASQSGLRHAVRGELVPVPKIGVTFTRTLARDSEGNLWVGTIGEGLARVGKDGVSLFRSPDPLPHNTIWCVFEDMERNIWVGTQDGLLRLSATAVGTVTASDGLDDDDVASVYEDPAGKIWIGTLAGRLHTMNGGRAVPFHVPPGVGEFHPRIAWTDPTGVQWLGSNGQGMLRIAGGATRIFSTADGLRSNTIRQVLRDRSGVIWIATGSGLSRWDGTAIRTYYLEDGLAYGGVRVLAEDTNGDLLVGTDRGMNRVRNGVFLRDPVLARLHEERIWAILPDRSGLWLGTRGNGLLRVRGNRIARLTTRQGLPGNSIYQILDGGDGRLWMSSSAGVFSASLAELDASADGRAGLVATVPWGIDEGMLSSQMNGGMQGAGFRSRSGEFWFPSVKGAVRIVPGQRPAAPPQPVVVESVTAGDMPIRVAESVVIPPGRGKLQIDFTSPSLASPDRVSFQYRLEGFDEAWTATTKGRTALYTNIPPGKYRFHVIARSGVWPGRFAETVLPVVWLPHFYETAWFYASLLVFSILVLVLALRMYARTTRARFALVLAERTRLAREMHDTVIQGCVGVSSLLEAARSLPPSAAGGTRPLLDRAAEQIRLTVNEAREAVWDLRHSDPAVERDAGAVVRTLETFVRQAEASAGIPVRVEVTGTPAPLGERAGRNLLLVAREAIRNAAAHARPSAISVHLAFGSDAVRLEVSDDGPGFDPGTASGDGHYGIIGMRERMRQSGGTLELMSAEGNGTRVIARLPVRNSSK